MNKTTKKILYALPIVIGAYILIRQFTKKPKPKPPVIDGGTPIGGGGTPSPGGGGGTSRNDNFPLKKGSKGANVTRMQKALLKCNPSALPRYGADGDFGSETEAALVSKTGKNTVDTQQDLINLEYSCGTWVYGMTPPSGGTPRPPFGPPFGSF